MADDAEAGLLAAPTDGDPEPWRLPGVLGIFDLGLAAFIQADVASEAGLAPGESFDLSTSFEFADESALLRNLLSPGPVSEAVRHSGERAVADAILGALAPHRRPDGNYRLENEWHFLLTRA